MSLCRAIDKRLSSILAIRFCGKGIAVGILSGSRRRRLAMACRMAVNAARGFATAAEPAAQAAASTSQTGRLGGQPDFASMMWGFMRGEQDVRRAGGVVARSGEAGGGGLCHATVRRDRHGRSIVAGASSPGFHGYTTTS